MPAETLAQKVWRSNSVTLRMPIPRHDVLSRHPLHLHRLSTPYLAESGGFEPPNLFRDYPLSRRTPSTYSANSPYYNKSAWRKAGDSNPEDAINAYTLSRRAPSPIRTALREALSVSLLILYQKIGAIVKKKIRGRAFFIDPTPFIY